MLKIWLPLNGDLHNQGLADVVVTNNGATVNDAGKIGKCYSFDGSDDYISLDSPELYDIIKGGSQPFTIAFWIYHADATRAILFGDYGLSGTIQFNIELNTSHFIRFYWAASPDFSATNTFATLNTWTHIAIAYDGSKIDFYTNGELTFTRSGVLAEKNKTSGMYYLGRDSRTGTTAFNGRLNDVRIYDEAISPKLAKELSKGLVLHYPLNDNSIQVLDNCYAYPTFETTTAQGGWSHWGGTGNKGNYGQNTDKNYIFRKNQTYSHWISDGADATAAFLLYQNPAFNGGIRSLQCICKEENGSEINETIVYPDWNARSGGVPTKKWTTIIPLGNGFYYCKCEGVQQDGSNNLIGFYVRPGYKVYFSEAYVENDKSVCSDIFFPSSNVYDVSGYQNNGSITGDLTCSSDTPRYMVSTVFNSGMDIESINPLSACSQFTIAGWINLTTGYATNNGFHLIGFVGTYCRICISKDGMAVRILLTDGTTNYAGGSAMTASALIAEKWNHYAITFDEGNINIYINGVLDTTGTATITSVAFPSNHIRIGRHGTEQPKGKASDIRFYSTALSADDILSLYHTPTSITNNGTLLTQGEISEV